MRRHKRHQHDEEDDVIGDEAARLPDGHFVNPSKSDLEDASAAQVAPADEVELSPAAASLVKQLQTERDQALDARLRALADFRNYQRRATEAEHRAESTGAARLVRSIMPVLDHFDLILAQKADQMTLDQLLSAVNIVRDEFNKALAAQGVERIDPGKGEPFDPHRHEAVMRQPADGAEPNTVVSTMQAGYAMGDLVLRPAKVAVAMNAE